MGGRYFQYVRNGTADDPRTFNVGDHVWLVEWDRAEPWGDYDLEDARIVHAVIREIHEQETTVKNGVIVLSLFRIMFENDCNDANWATFEYRTDGWAGTYIARSEEEAIENVAHHYTERTKELQKELLSLQAKFNHCNERQIITVEIKDV